jgi:hypothetical protein
MWEDEPMSVGQVLPLLLLATCLAGVVVFVVGWRGRVVAGSRLCRGCRFDLVGIAGAANCPECGAALGGGSATVERRLRSVRLLTLGGVIIFGSLAVGGGLAANRAWQANLNPYKPVWVLKMEASGVPSARSAASINELSRRLRTGILAQADIDRLVTHAIALRSTPSVPQDLAWSDFIELARVNGAVTDAQWVTYVRSGLALTCSVRQTMRAGRSTPISLTVGGPLLGSSPPEAARARVRYAITGMAIGEHQAAFNSRSFGQSTVGRGGSSGSSVSTTAPAATGTFQARVTCTFQILDPGGVSERVLGEWSQEFVSDVKVVPESVAVVRGERDDALSPRVRAALTATLQLDSPRMLGVMVQSNRPPANLAFEVFIRPCDGSAAGKEFKAGSISFAAGGTLGYGTSADAEAWDARYADVVLRPSIEAAEANVALESIWLGPEIVLPRVAIPRPADAAGPGR